MPSVLVTVIVRMAPVGAGIRRMIPASRNPHVAAAIDTPVSVNPGESFTRRRGPARIADRRRRSATDDNDDLRKRRSGSSGKYGHAKRSRQESRFPIRFQGQPPSTNNAWMPNMLCEQFCGGEKTAKAYLFNNGVTSGTTFFATIAFPFAVACRSE